jgi:hypothetical protein
MGGAFVIAALDHVDGAITWDPEGIGMDDGVRWVGPGVQAITRPSFLGSGRGAGRGAT